MSMRIRQIVSIFATSLVVSFVAAGCAGGDGGDERSGEAAGPVDEVAGDAIDAAGDPAVQNMPAPSRCTDCIESCINHGGGGATWGGCASECKSLGECGTV